MSLLLCFLGQFWPAGLCGKYESLHCILWSLAVSRPVVRTGKQFFGFSWVGYWTWTRIRRWVLNQKYGENPQIIHFNRVFHYFHHPFWFFFPLFLETPRCSFCSSKRILGNILTHRQCDSFKMNSHRLPYDTACILCIDSSSFVYIAHPRNIWSPKTDLHKLLCSLN